MKTGTVRIAFLAVVVIALAWRGARLNKLKLSKRYTAKYNCTIEENYWVDKQNGSQANKEQMISHVEMALSQDVLIKKKHLLHLDNVITNFTRKDSIIRNKTIDTASNKGVMPLQKNIFYFSRKGDFLGTALESKNPKLKTRDYKYFYNTAKQLVYKIQDSAIEYNTWHSTRTDTVLSTGFQLIFSYPLTWQTKAEKDTLGLHCVELSYQSPSVKYFAANSVMKALGIETYHKGLAAINGFILIEKKTGRVIRLNEYGSFIGDVEMKTSKENTAWPSVYRYSKHFVLDSLIKKPRKKILGIF